MSHHPDRHEHTVNVKKVDRVSPTKVKLSIELPYSEVEKHESSMTREFAKGAKIPGFRPGKAPLQVIRQKFGDEIKKQLLSHLIQAGLMEAVTQKNLIPVSQPKISLKDVGLTSSMPFEFEAEYDVQPEIEIRNYKNIPVKARSVVVTDEEVNTSVEDLRNRMAVLEPTNAERVEKGGFALVEIGYELKAELPKREPRKPYTIEISAGTLLPGLEQAFLEMKVGEERKIEAAFPSDYQDRELANVKALFDCRLVEVKKKIVPEFDDTFADQIKQGSTAGSLREEIRVGILKQKEEEINKAQRREIMEYLVSSNRFEVPVSVINERFKSLIEWMDQENRKRGVAPQNHSEEDLESIRKRAEYMVRSSLLLKEIAVKEQITLDEKKVKERVKSFASQIGKNEEGTLSWLKEKGMLEAMKDEVLTDQVFDFLVKNAHVTAGVPPNSK